MSSGPQQPKLDVYFLVHGHMIADLVFDLTVYMTNIKHNVMYWQVDSNLWQPWQHFQGMWSVQGSGLPLPHPREILGPSGCLHPYILKSNLALYPLCHTGLHRITESQLLAGDMVERICKEPVCKTMYEQPLGDCTLPPGGHVEKPASSGIGARTLVRSYHLKGFTGMA